MQQALNTESLSNNTSKIAKNTLMLYIRLLVSMVVGFFSSRIILQALGEIDYGVYTLIGGVVVLFSFINSALATATQRYLTIEIGKNNIPEFYRVFKISFTTHVLIAVIIFVLVEIVGMILLNNYLHIPAERMVAAKYVLHFSTLTFLIQVIQIPFNSAIIANEKMSFYAWLSIFEVLLKLGVAILLLYVLRDKLIVYSILLFLAALVVFGIYYFYCRVKLGCETSLCWDKNLAGEMITFSSWRLLGGGARIAEQQGFNFALNLFVGIVANAAIGVANQLSSLVNSFVTNFQVAFNPQITKYYSVGQYEEMFTLSYRTSKLSFYLLFLLCLPLIGDINYYLILWLKTPPALAASFCVVILINMMIEAISAPLWMMIIASGKIAKYQILLSSIILLGTALSIVLLALGVRADLSMDARVLATIIILIMRLILLRAIVNYPTSIYCRKVLLPILMILIPSIGFYFIVSLFSLHPIANSIILFICSSVLVYCVGLDKDEKLFVKSRVSKIIYKSI